MKIIRSADINGASDFFQVLATTKKSQFAIMNLADNEVSGEFGTDHPQADQVLYVLEGSGSIKVEDQEEPLAPGDVVILPAGAKHQVRGPNKSINFYAPVAYPDEG